MLFGELFGGLKGWFGLGGVYGGELRIGVNGMSLLCKFIFLVLVDLSLIFLSFLEGDEIDLFLLMMFLYLMRFFLFEVFLIKICVEEFLGEDIEVFFFFLFEREEKNIG